MFKIGSKVRLVRCIFGYCEGVCSQKEDCKIRGERGVVTWSDHESTKYIVITSGLLFKGKRTEADNQFLRQVDDRFSFHRKRLCEKCK